MDQREGRARGLGTEAGRAGGRREAQGGIGNDMVGLADGKGGEGRAGK